VRGEARAKLIAALTEHHQYAKDSYLNQEPIGNNELAKKADVSKHAASKFFKKVFKGHAKYRACCINNTSSLIAVLKWLNDEFTPHILLERELPGQAHREDDE
jgi:hypothetical protein